MNYSATYDAATDRLTISSSSHIKNHDPENYERIKKLGFRWAPMQERFYATWSPAGEDLLAELAGDIDEETATLADRAEDRAERFEGYGEKRGQEAESAHKAVDYIAQRFAGGQPILVGHHSERGARRDAERIENGMRRAIKLRDVADYWERRAQAARSQRLQVRFSIS